MTHIWFVKQFTSFIWRGLSRWTQSSTFDWFKIGLIQTPRCWFMFGSKGGQFIAARKFWHQIEDQQDAENYWWAPQWKSLFKRQHVRYIWNRMICWTNRRAACKKQMWRNTLYIYIYSMIILLAESVKKDPDIYHLIMYIFDIFYC